MREVPHYRCPHHSAGALRWDCLGYRKKGDNFQATCAVVCRPVVSQIPLGRYLWKTERCQTHIAHVSITKFYSSNITLSQVEKETTLSNQNPNRREVYSQLQGQFLFFLLPICLPNAVPYSAFLTYFLMSSEKP